MFALNKKNSTSKYKNFTEKSGMTFANFLTYECPIFAETEMNQHFGKIGQLISNSLQTKVPP
jgi:hypothetical protein